METVVFSVDYDLEPMLKNVSLKVGVSLSEDDIAIMRKLVLASGFDKDANLMNILLNGAFDIYGRLNNVFQDNIKLEMVKHDREETSVFDDDYNEEEEREFTCTENELEEYEDVSYFCHIPESLISNHC